MKAAKDGYGWRAVEPSHKFSGRGQNLQICTLLFCYLSCSWPHLQHRQLVTVLLLEHVHVRGSGRDWGFAHVSATPKHGHGLVCTQEPRHRVSNTVEHRHVAVRTAVDRGWGTTTNGPIGLRTIGPNQVGHGVPRCTHLGPTWSAQSIDRQTGTSRAGCGERRLPARVLALLQGSRRYCLSVVNAGCVHSEESWLQGAHPCVLQLPCSRLHCHWKP